MKNSGPKYVILYDIRSIHYAVLRSTVVEPSRTKRKCLLPWPDKYFRFSSRNILLFLSI